MNTILETLGVRRVLPPSGALPQGAASLNTSLPLQPYELEIDVEMLVLDSTSFRQLSESNDGDARRIGDTIMKIVAQRGKMQNPETQSGGILTGIVTAVGTDYPEPPSIGTRVVSLASLTLTPLKLESVQGIEVGRPHVHVKGTAYLPSTAPWTTFPKNLPINSALAALDVCNAASQTRALMSDSTKTVLVLGGGNAGLLALSAARDTHVSGRRVILMDASESACARARKLNLCDDALQADLRDAVASLRMLEQSGTPRADLTVVVVNATDCEAAALLMTADHGTVLFFSMATSFTKAALGSEGMASGARMLIGSGYMPDRGSYAMQLLSLNFDLANELGGD